MLAALIPPKAPDAEYTAEAQTRADDNLVRLFTRGNPTMQVGDVLTSQDVDEIRTHIQNHSF